MYQNHRTNSLLTWMFTCMHGMTIQLYWTPTFRNCALHNTNTAMSLNAFRVRLPLTYIGLLCVSVSGGFRGVPPKFLLFSHRVFIITPPIPNYLTIQSYAKTRHMEWIGTSRNFTLDAPLVSVIYLFQVVLHTFQSTGRFVGLNVCDAKWSFACDL